MLLSTLAHLGGAGTWTVSVASGACLVFLALAWRRAGRVGVVLLVAAAGLAVALAETSDQAWTVIQRGLGQAAFLGTLVLVLGLVRDAAVTSPTVTAAGRVIVHQPPGRRYATLCLGSHLLTILLNLGALSLLSAVIRGGIGASATVPGEATSRERRSLSATLRGFGAATAWAPTTIAQALIVTSIPGVLWTDTAVFGFAAAMLITAVGWLLDNLEGRDSDLPDAMPARPSAREWRSVWLLLVPVGLLLAVVTLLKAVFGFALIEAVVAVGPAFWLGWVLLQTTGSGSDSGNRLLRLRLYRIVRDQFPAASPEIVVLASAAFIGAAIAALMPALGLEDLLNFGHWPAAGLIAAAAAFVMLGHQVAINPIITVTIVGAIVQQANLDPTLAAAIAVALGVAWATTVVVSPFGISVLLLARLADRPARTVAWGWQGLYAPLALAIAVLAIIAGHAALT